MNKSQIIIRLFDQDKDFSQLVNLRAVIEACDQAGNDTSEVAARDFLGWPGHDSTQDRWVVEDPYIPDQLFGYTWVRTQSRERTIVYIATHPDWGRRGLGRTLLDRAIARAHEYKATHVTAAADVKNKNTDAFLRRNGFSPAGNNRFMCAPQGISLPKARWPPGYFVRNFADVQDLSTLVAVFNRCFGDMWGHRENTQGAMNERYLAESMQKYPEWYIPKGVGVKNVICTVLRGLIAFSRRICPFKKTAILNHLPRLSSMKDIGTVDDFR